MTIQEILNWAGCNPWLTFGLFVGTAWVIKSTGNFLASFILALKGKSNMARIPFKVEKNKIEGKKDISVQKAS